MAILNKKFKVIKYSKDIGNKFNYKEFKVVYNKKSTGILNYIINVDFLLDQQELVEFLKFYNDELNAIGSFNAHFEILRQTENVNNFIYKFAEPPSVKQSQGDMFNVSASFVRIIEGCPSNYLLILTALNNLKRNNQGENRSDSMYVSCPIAFQNLGVQLMNLYNTLEKTPYDYSLSYTFT